MLATHYNIVECLSTILFSTVTPGCGLDSGSTNCSVLLTTLNNVGSTTLFNPVFNNLQQLVIFTCVRFPLIFATNSSYVFYSKAAILYFCLSKLLCTKTTRASRVFIELYRNTSFSSYFICY